MKKSLLIFISLLFISCSMVYDNSKEPSFNRIYEIESWIRENIKYESDLSHLSLDDWKKPQRTIKDGFGDCEDLSQVWCYFMEKDFNIETEIYVGIHSDIRNNHVWAESKDGQYTFYKAEDNKYLFIKKYSYSDIVKYSRAIEEERK
jgi:hypothetical protein